MADCNALKSQLRGELIQPGDGNYDDARKLYNAMIDKKPAAIARCVDVADVMACVNHARSNGILRAVRGGGHNGPGLGSCDGGLVIDLSRMRGVWGEELGSKPKLAPVPPRRVHLHCGIFAHEDTEASCSLLALVWASCFWVALPSGSRL